jgi:hypothetical protein
MMSLHNYYSLPFDIKTGKGILEFSKMNPRYSWVGLMENNLINASYVIIRCNTNSQSCQ